MSSTFKYQIDIDLLMVYLLTNSVKVQPYLISWWMIAPLYFEDSLDFKSKSISRFQIKHAFREANKCADALANLERSQFVKFFVFFCST